MVDRIPASIGEAIAKAALDPDAWQDVMDAILAAFPGTKTGIVGHDTALVRNIPSVFAGYDPSFAPSYEAHYSHVIPNIRRWTDLPIGHVAHVWEIMSEEQLLRSEYYNDWLRPQGDARQAAITVLHRDPSRLFLFTTQVEEQVADSTMEPVMQLVRGIYPMMRHALEINRMMFGLRIDSTLLRFGIEPEGVAILLIEANGRLLYANARTEAFLADGRLIRLDAQGRLRFVDCDAAAHFDAALDPRKNLRMTSFRVKGGIGPQVVRLMRLFSDTLTQIRRPSLLCPTAPTHLLVLRPDSTPSDEIGEIVARLGLTRTEAEVSLALAGGATVSEVADLRGVSVHTVRGQVKVALAKTGSRRQAELVRLIEALRHSL